MRNYTKYNTANMKAVCLLEDVNVNIINSEVRNLKMHLSLSFPLAGLLLIFHKQLFSSKLQAKHTHTW